MKKTLTSIAIAATFGLASFHASAEDCAAPASPIIPDGNVASEDELVSAQKAIKMFQDSLIGYRECLDKNTAAIDQEAEDAEALTAEISVAYNESIDAETRLADEFNAAVRAFKARQ